MFGDCMTMLIHHSQRCGAKSVARSSPLLVTGSGATHRLSAPRRNLLDPSLPPDVVRRFAHRFVCDEVVQQRYALYGRVTLGRPRTCVLNGLASSCG